MATGTYGTIRPSDVSPEDVDIIMLYTPSRDETNNFVLTKLNSVSLLRPYFNNAQTGGNTDVEVLGGLYNLKLPSDQFNKLGIYTLYLRPTEIRTTILDSASAVINLATSNILSGLPTEVPPNFIIFIRQLFDCLRKNGIQ
jgi:hypothetical protein